MCGKSIIKIDVALLNYRSTVYINMSHFNQEPVHSPPFSSIIKSHITFRSISDDIIFFKCFGLVQKNNSIQY